VTPLEGPLGAVGVETVSNVSHVPPPRAFEGPAHGRVYGEFTALVPRTERPKNSRSAGPAQSLT
jgi:hypothetical protein